MTSSIITTDKAKCRDCYRCVRVCPVKAIRISDAQARVDAERCILCGTCVRECPQQAKHVRSDLGKVAELLATPDLAVASVAPSFPAAFADYGSGLLPAALKKLGFGLVTETAVGAEMVAFATADVVSASKSASWVTSACPVVVNLIERYYPECCEHITPIASPMTAHASYLKAKYGKDIKVIFIGPCAAKKDEAEKTEGLVDAVLTFEELQQMLAEAGIDPRKLQPAAFDDVRPKNAQLFPLEGGLARTASINSGLLTEDFAAVSGRDHVREMIDHLTGDSAIRLFEALFCPGGCINGPCVGATRDIFARKSRVLQYHKRKTFEAEQEFDAAPVLQSLNLSMAVGPVHVPQPNFSEEEIRAVLAETGKNSVEDELNCGACGYTSCRENALAVLSGMAEGSMCLPYMRRLAERKTVQIIDNSPNGIVVVDSNFNIVSFNPAFANMFSCTDKIIGRPIGVLMDPADFEIVAAELVDRISGKTVALPQYGMIANESIYRLEGDNVMIGIFANITKTKEDEDRIAHIRSETLANTQRVIEKQMRMAQEIASILGETTSETRVLLRKLTDLVQEVDDQNGR